MYRFHVKNWVSFRVYVLALLTCIIVFFCLPKIWHNITWKKKRSIEKINEQYRNSISLRIPAKKYDTNDPMTHWSGRVSCRWSLFLTSQPVIIPLHATTQALFYRHVLMKNVTARFFILRVKHVTEFTATTISRVRAAAAREAVRM